jgi:pimeloyl-ACP methyl ester carboxylesterase
MYNPSLAHLLGGVRCPSLVIWGEQDRVVPAATADQFVAALRNGRREIIRNCGHAVEMEQPAELAHLVSSFVRAD